MMQLRFWFVLLVCFILCPVEAKEPIDPSPKELDQYLALPDDAFRWEIIEKRETANERSWLLEMTSQNWHGIVWKHSMLVCLPNKIVYPEQAILYIGGGSIGRKAGTGDQFLARSLAETAGMPTAILLQVPNQPLFGGHREDSLIGETMLKAIETKDATWPLLFPMAKSALRAMDTVQQLLKKEHDMDVKGFVVAGASKRGWTTWLTAASKDPRVLGIAPTVIDTLNMRRQMEYQVETWGEHSPSIHDYTSRNLVQADPSKTSEFEKSLWEMVDPYSYRTRLTLPKLLIHGTNDPYWVVDATKNYWDDLPGVKYILTLPNAGHGLDNQQIKAAQSLAVFARHVASKNPWPTFTWKLEDSLMNYVVRLSTDFPINRAKLWTAYSETKDFRKAQWKSKSIKTESGQPIEIPKPASGHIAFFIELEGTEYGVPYSITTQVWRY